MEQIYDKESGKCTLSPTASRELAENESKIETTPPEYIWGFNPKYYSVVNGKLKPCCAEEKGRIDADPALAMSEVEALAYRITEAKKLRDAIEFGENIEALGVIWQVDALSKERIKDAIDEATREGYPDDFTIPWILADNSLRQSTRADLGAVLSAFNQRRRKVFVEYGVWLAGDLSTAFQPNMEG